MSAPYAIADEPVYAAIRRRMRLFRQRAGLTAAQVGAAMGLGKGGEVTVLAWEHGHKRPSFPRISRLAQVLGISYFFLLFDDVELYR